MSPGQAQQQAKGLEHCNESIRVFRDSIANSAGFLVSSLASLFVIPLMLKVLPAEIYGLWITTFALAETAAFFNSGISRGLAREVSGCGGDGRDDREIGSFVSACGAAFVVLGILGAAYTFVAGMGMSRALRLGETAKSVAPSVIGLLAVSFVGEQISIFATQVLAGMRRFVLINSLRIAAIPLRIGGLVILLLLRSTITRLAAWYAISTFVIAVANVAVVRTIRPDWLAGIWPLDLRPLKRQLSFSAWSQITDWITGLVAQSPAMLVGSVRGASSIVPFYVGQRIPAAIEVAGWRAANVVFPASSEYRSKGANQTAARVFESASRSMVGLFYPFVIALWFVGPAVFRVWLKSDVGSEPIAVFKTLLIWNLIAAVTAPAVQILWGHGKAGSVLRLTLVSGVVNVGTSFVLLKHVGLIGPAIGIALGEAILGIGALWLTSHDYNVSIASLLRAVYGAFVFPMLAGAAVAFALHGLASSWATIVAVILASVATYAAVFCAFSVSAEQRLAFRIALRGLLPSRAGAN